jgi:hypothetical protein
MVQRTSAHCDILLIWYIIQKMALDYHKAAVLEPQVQQKVAHTFSLVW